MQNSFPLVILYLQESGGVLIPEPSLGVWSFVDGFSRLETVFFRILPALINEYRHSKFFENNFFRILVTIFYKKNGGAQCAWQSRGQRRVTNAGLFGWSSARGRRRARLQKVQTWKAFGKWYELISAAYVLTRFEQNPMSLKQNPILNFCR